MKIKLPKILRRKPGKRFGERFGDWKGIPSRQPGESEADYQKRAWPSRSWPSDKNE